MGKYKNERLVKRMESYSPTLRPGLCTLKPFMGMTSPHSCWYWNSRFASIRGYGRIRRNLYIAIPEKVKVAKRAIMFAVGKRRLSVLEFLTVCSEAANLLNERPIGITNDLSVFTPNSLSLGRATSKNPAVWQPYICSQNPKTRYHLVQSAADDFWEK